MDDYKSFLSQKSGYKSNTPVVDTVEAERACRIAQREILEKVSAELRGLLKKDNTWIDLPDALKNIKALRDSIQDGWKQ